MFVAKFRFRLPTRPSCLFALILALLFAAIACTPTADESRPIDPTVYARTPADFARFFEERVPKKLNEHHIAGAVVSVVQGGRIVYRHGFGFADPTAKTPVDPARTLFRAASISKLFVWTGLMQLIEQGRVDLDADVNRYVERRDETTGAVVFRIPDAFDRPIRVRDLFTHTPGFEDRVINLFTNDPARAQTLRESIETLPPNRVRAPGVEIAYSNYGAALGGYIIERVSGMPFEEYVEKNIFAPLAMTHSTFQQPVPATLANDLSGGYIYDPSTQTFTRQVFEIINGAPAGGLSTTAEDLGRFLIAHLGDGAMPTPPADASGRILSTATAQTMHSTLFRPHPQGNGFAHGFIEFDSHGQRMVGHAGDTIFFHSLAAILPETDVGFFIATNSATGMLAVAELREDFLNAFYPAPTGGAVAQNYAATRAADAGAPPAVDDLRKYAGYFATNRRSEREITKIMSLFMTLDVAMNARGDGLLIRDMFSSKLLDCVRIMPDLFQERAGHKRFAFLRNEAGEIQSFIPGDLPVMTFQRVVWYESPPLHFAIIAGAIILLLVGLIARPTGIFAIVSRKYRATIDRDARRAGWLGTGMIVSYLTFIAVTAVLSGGIEVVFTIPAHWPFYIPFAAFLFQLAALTYVMPAWSRKYWSLPGRIIFTATVVGLLPFFWFLYYWNLVAG